MSRLLKLVQKVNNFYLTGFKSGKYSPFLVDGFQVGLISPDIQKVLANHPNVFVVNDTYVQLHPIFTSTEQKTNEVDKVLKDWRDKDLFTSLKGWRHEKYDVKREYSASSLLQMERAATCLFGIHNYGVDVNGYIMHPKLGCCIWLQKRSAKKQTFPNKWDSLVGGGIKAGESLIETVYKESIEEASIPKALMMKNMRSVGTVSFFFEDERGIFPDTGFEYEIELPLDFHPKNLDGEVQEFMLLPAMECYEKLFSLDFKTTSIPRVLDFLIRHGYINAEIEPDFPQIVELLHVPLQTIYTMRL